MTIFIIIDGNRTMEVTGILETWYHIHKRDLPWRNSDSPYHIWLSEVILQQTRVDQGLEYYTRFIEKYPYVEDLAKARIDEILKLWQGLGYYTRARNLHSTAQRIVSEYNGLFPAEYEELVKLKGIGAYTAAAIASIAFKKPVALVDGNVFRVIARLYGIETPVDSSAGKNLFNKLAYEILNKEKPDIHNQALMEFGALVCTPRNPKCSECMLATLCHANLHGTAAHFPVKKGKIKTRIRYFNYLFIQYERMTLLRKRFNKDIWHSLYEFPLVETDAPANFNLLMNTDPWKSLLGKSTVTKFDKTRKYRHQLTHQTLMCCFYLVRPEDEPDFKGTDFIGIKLDNINEFAVPRAIDRYLHDLANDGML